MRRPGMWDTLRQDIVFALRLARRDRALTTVALLTFALGIGANTAIYSVVHGVLLRPLPFENPSQLAAIWPMRSISNAELEYLQANARTFSEVALFSPGWSSALTNAGEPRQVAAARVSSNFFATLGARPALGRVFAPDESQPGKGSVVILSDELWVSHFNSDPAVIGRVVSMDGNPHEIIGVMPSGFEAFQAGVEAWQPYTINPTSPFYTRQAGMGTGALTGRPVFGRLAPDATLAAATAELGMLAPRMSDAFGYADDYARGATVTDLHDSLVGTSRQPLLVLLGAVVLLVLIATANVGNLLVVHTIGRERELTVRRALGASRGRLARQLLVQGVLLALAGGTLGIAAGVGGLRLLKMILPRTLPMIESVSVDLPVLAFCALFTLATGIVLGLGPALFATRVDPDGVVRAGAAARSSRSTVFVRKSLAVVEVAVAVMLVIGAGLMGETMWRLHRIDLGFDTSNTLTFLIQPSSGQLTTPQQVDAYFNVMTMLFALEPDVTSVGAIQHLPLSGFNWIGALEIETRPLPTNVDPPQIAWRSITGDYFGTMRIPMVRGRSFAATDMHGGPPVVIINNAMAKQYWPDANPLGQRIKLGFGTAGEWAAIVGVVEDVRYLSPDQPSAPEVYRPNAQQSLTLMRYVLRTRGDPMTVFPRIRDAIRSLDKDVPIAEVRPLDDLLSASVKTRRTVAMLLASFAAIGLVLGTIGIYGIMSFGVRQRSRELAIRTALGAVEGRIIAMVLGEGLRLAAIGILIGTVGAVAGGRSLRTMVYGVETSDPRMYIVVAMTLALVAGLASWLPARRAARVDPLGMLRGD